ncbi:hypothetical protein BC829DRAFT_449271 [Chytridium lagenaria]|nr:hypothetical protein BC829DRAFT_449271 [Chytridium lagenaria]
MHSFHLLGSPASLKEFAIRCTNLRPPLETETLDLNKVLSNLIPTSHLTSLDIYLNVADATILEFAKFVSRCPSLRTFRMASTRENVMAEEDDQNKFLSLVSSAGNLKDVSLPYTLRSNGLVSIDRILCNGHPQFLKALDLRVGKDIDTLSGAHLLLRAPYVLESLNLDMFDVKEEIGKHISSLLHIVIVQEPRNLIRLCFSKIWLPDSEERIIQEVRSCLAVVERLASTSDRLRTIHFDAWNFGLSEKHLFEKVEEVRRLNGLRPVEIISSSTAYEMGASGFQDRSWRRKVGWRPIDALQRSNVTGEWILFPDEYYDGSMLKFGWNKAKMP